MSNYCEEHVLESEEITFANAYKTLVFSLLEEHPELILGDADLGRALYGAEYAVLKQSHLQQMYDVGIQEANLVGVASGLSVVGRIPLIHSFAAFITRRVYDTLFVSGAYAKLNMKLIGTDPGITSTYNGGTHMTFEDIGLINSIPNAVIFEPADLTALRKVLPQLIFTPGIAYMRMPRNFKPIAIYPENTEFTVGKSMTLREGKDATIIALGTEVAEALEAAEELSKENIQVRVLDSVTVKPLDEKAIIQAAKETGTVIVAENHNIKTGLFAAVCQVLAREAPCIAGAVAICDEFGEVGNYKELLRRFRLTSKDIAAEVRRCIQKKNLA